MIDELTRELNDFFGKPHKIRTRQVHVVNGVRITKKNKLWTATLPGGDTLFSSHLGDLKATIRREMQP